MAKIYLGTSGFMYRHWKKVFYPKDLPQRDWFSFYVKKFNTVELNVSFYRLPKKQTFVNWREKAGSSFVFTVKGSRYITHIKKLKEPQEPLKRFFEAADGLRIRGTKDVVLWQLPPRFKVNFERLGDFLKRLPSSWRHAFEFREESWNDTRIFKLLRQYGAAIVIQDYPQWPIIQEVTADFAYLRFHGKPRLYTSAYSKRELGQWAKKMRGWLKKGLDCYAYFNNDALGYAIENARELRALALKQKLLN